MGIVSSYFKIFRAVQPSLFALGLALSTTSPLLTPSLALADDSELTLGIQSETSQKPSAFQLFKSKTRLRFWSEYMSPTFANIPTPQPDSNDNYYLFPPSYAIAWIDYDIGKDYRLLYWQRSFVFINNFDGSHDFKLGIRNPRFALRKVNVINVPNLSTTYDLYVQLGLAGEADRGGRHYELGFRTNHSYSFPNSKFSAGMTTEVTFAYSLLDDKTKGADMYGWIGPWVSYEINPTLSTMHFWAYNFQHLRTAPFGYIQLDDPRPFMENGLGVNVTKDTSLTFLIGNYTLELFTLRTTWASVWLSINIL